MSIPVAPGRLPLVGHLAQLFARPLQFLNSLRHVGELVRVDLGSAPMVMITDAKLTRQVLLDSRTFEKGGPFFDRLSELCGESLLTSKSEPHRRQRRLIQPAFDQARMQGYSAIMAEAIDDVLGEWRDGAVVDMTAAAYDITVRSSARTVFAAEIARTAGRHIVDALSTYAQGMFIRTMVPARLLDLVPTPGNLRYLRAVKLLHASVDEIIAAYRATGVDHGDLLSMLLAHREDDSALTPQEVHDQVLTLFLAGTETTAAVIAWSLYLLGAHPAMMERLRAEVDTVLAGQEVRWDHLTKLPETQRVITEALRLYPPAWLFTRVTTEDVALGAHHLPKGTGIGCSPYLLHHNPDLFEAPDRFDPDRWLPERARTVPKEAFIPFGGGARKCIGDAFGLIEATLVLATITARWDLHPTLDRPVQPVPRRAALTPGALPMRVRSRAHRASSAETTQGSG
jgi:cytochrome P450